MTEMLKALWSVALLVAAGAATAAPMSEAERDDALAAVPTGGGPFPETGEMLVYYRSAGSMYGFTSFAAAAGKTLNVEAQALPLDLSRFDCVVLALNEEFTPVELLQLSLYVNLGGNLIAVGDNENFFAEANAAMNSVATAVGSTIRIAGGAIDPGYWVTTNVEPGPLTTGVSRLMYAWFSELDAGATGQVLARSASGADVLIAAEPIGMGVFALQADLNTLSDTSGTGYATADNGRLADNLCNGSLG